MWSHENQLATLFVAQNIIIRIFTLDGNWKKRRFDTHIKNVIEQEIMPVAVNGNLL